MKSCNVVNDPNIVLLDMNFFSNGVYQLENPSLSILGIENYIIDFDKDNKAVIILAFLKDEESIKDCIVKISESTKDKDHIIVISDKNEYILGKLYDLLYIYNILKGTYQIHVVVDFDGVPRKFEDINKDIVLN